MTDNRPPTTDDMRSLQHSHGSGKPMNVLMFADTVGGVWTYAVEICSALREQNVFFHLVTAGAPLQVWQKQQLSALDNIEVHETTYPLEWMNEPWAEIDASGEWLLQLEEQVQPDIIHLNAFAYGALPFKAPVVMVAHSDVYSWYREVKNEQPAAQWEEYFNRIQRGLEGADFVIAPSREMRYFTREMYGVRKPVEVIYNARTKGIFHSGRKEKVVFSMGRVWDEAKNIRLLVDAAPHIHHPIRIAGDNNFENNSCELSQGCINYLGKLSTEQLSKELSTASLFVLPTKYEPFGLSPLEAALSGCALVLGDIASLREIWKDNALYVDTGDAVKLANTINDLMENETKLKQYAAKALAHAQQYSTSAFAQNYLNLYRQAMLHRRATKSEAITSEMLHHK